VAAGVLGLVAATGVAAADTDTPSPTTSTGSGSSATVTASDEARQRFGKRHPWLVAASKVMHGELVVETEDGTQTVLVQKGTVDSVGEGGLTVTSEDGFTVDWTTDESTRVHRNGDEATLSALTPGEKVWLRGPKTDSGTMATVIRTGERS
jgi:hypothetical protein